MSDATLNLTPALYTYLQKVSLREGPVLQALRDRTHAMPMSIMQISPEQGQFMQLLIELIGARKALELGVFTGYSTLCVALALPADGRIVACDVDEVAVAIAKQYWQQAGVTHKIDVRIGKALDTLQNLMDCGEANTFDFVFIDADKSNYPAYYEKSLALLRPGGLMAIDNVLMDGKVIDFDNQEKRVQVMRSLNEMLLNDERVTISLLPIGDGLTLARKRQ